MATEPAVKPISPFVTQSNHGEQTATAEQPNQQQDEPEIISPIQRANETNEENRGLTGRKPRIVSERKPTQSV